MLQLVRHEGQLDVDARHVAQRRPGRRGGDALLGQLLRAGVDATDLYNGTDGKLHDIDGVNQWPAIMGASPVPVPRPYVPTTSTSILWSAPNGTIYKLITSAYRSNRFHANGSQYMDSSHPCLRQEDVTAADARAAHRHFSGQSAVGTETYAWYERMIPGLRLAREALARGAAPPQHQPRVEAPWSPPGCPRNYTGNCTVACFHPGLCQERANMVQEVRGVVDPAACCAACKTNPACVAWNTNTPRKLCRLLSDWEPNPGGDCVSGALRVPGPAPPAPSSNCLVCRYVCTLVLRRATLGRCPTCPVALPAVPGCPFGRCPPLPRVLPTHLLARCLVRVGVHSARIHTR